MANPVHLANLKQGVSAWNELRRQEMVDHLSGASLSGADLKNANLAGVDLRLADLGNAHLDGADLSYSDLSRADFFGADLRSANLRHAELIEANLTQVNAKDANLHRADLRGANLKNATLRNADLSKANLSRATLLAANLLGAKLDGADCRSAQLQDACLDESDITDIQLWETQRAGWSIKGVLCERAFWDKNAKTPTPYAPGEFERLYSDQTSIELFYQGGVSTFELNTLPSLLHHLATLHPNSYIRLKSIEETGGGAKILINVSEADAETTARIKADATQVYQAQLALRENELNRETIEKKYLEKLLFSQLIPAMLSAAAPQNVFNAPVTGLAFSSGESSVSFSQSNNDNSAILALLETVISRRNELNLPDAYAMHLEAELNSASAELQKNNPDKTVLSKSLTFIQKFASEAATKAAAKLGETAATDWQTWAHQLGQFLHHIK